jgi:MiaB/RimO family radical SAM methylthiotransferase
MKRVCIIDGFAGCALNSYDSTLFEEFFKKNEWEIVDNYKKANLILLNTCAFVKNVEDKVINKIIEIKNNIKKNQELIVCGCFPRINEIKLKKYFNGIYFGAKENYKLNKLIKSKIKIEDIRISGISRRYSHGIPSNMFYVKIAEGCLGNCSFCAIKNAKGNLKSKLVSEVLGDFKRGLKSGYKEFVLLGDDIGCYGVDIKTNISSLLKKILKIEGDYRLYLHFFEPFWFNKYFDELKDILSSSKITLLNLPIQSANNRILRLMNRNYDINKLIKNVKIIKQNNKDLIIQTHLIAGFPSESIDEFEESLKKAEVFDIVKIFFYSARENTKAYPMGEIDLKTKNEMIELIKKRNEKEIGKFIVIQK